MINGEEGRGGGREREQETETEKRGGGRNMERVKDRERAQFYPSLTGGTNGFKRGYFALGSMAK